MNSDSTCLLQQIEISRSFLKDLRSQKNSCDIYLVCDDEKLPAHRQILQIGSKYFNSMFSSDLKEVSSNEVILPTIRKESMEIILDFIYLQNVNVNLLSDEQIRYLLSGAHLLEIYPLVEVCGAELISKINSENWATMLGFAQKYSIEKLILEVVKYLSFTDLSADNKFLELEFDCFSALITNSSLKKFHSADMLVRFISAWVAYNKLDRKQHLQSLFSVIDFASLSKGIITNLTSNDNDLFDNNPELSHILLQKVSQAFIPNLLVSSANSKLLIFKSNFVSSYDLTTKVWSVHTMLETLMPMPCSQIAVSAQVVYYVAEAAIKCSRKSDKEYSNQRESQTHIIAYYPHLNCGNQITTLSEKANFGMVFWNNALYFVGGRVSYPSDGQQYCFDGLECLDLNLKTWNRLASPKFCRKDPTLVTLDDNLYLFGGKIQKSIFDCTLIRDVEKYCSATNQWTVIISLHDRICGDITVVPCLAKIFVTVKIAPVFLTTQPKLYEFDPKDNSWKEIQMESYGVLCGSSKPLPFLVFVKDRTNFYQMDVQDKNVLMITQENVVGGTTSSSGKRLNDESETIVIFA